MTLLREDPELQRPIEDVSQLVDFFRSGEKSTARFRVGTEHEKIGLYERTLASVPFEGEHGIGALLGALQREHGFGPLLDGETLVGLEKNGATITLEPGGQLELSGAPMLTLHETCLEFREHVALLKQISQRFGIVWLGLGVHPLAKVEEIPRMPRERHQIMRAHIAAQGRLGLWMMHATGTVQANFDYCSQGDLARKLRVALAASPIVTAMYANSCISGGQTNGFESFRAFIWRHTDPARCGLLPFVFDPSFAEETAYLRYAEWALEVPTLFIVRDGAHLPLGGIPFREFVAHGYEGHRATFADFNLHLTTLFPEVRLKRVIEVRGADAVPPGLVCALPAFWKGLLYDPDALSEARERLERFGFAEVDALHEAVAQAGLGAAAPGGSVLELARELVDLAGQGLARLDQRNRAGETEALFLEPLYEILDRGKSPAARVLEHWEGSFAKRVDRLVQYAKY